MSVLLNLALTSLLMMAVVVHASYLATDALSLAGRFRNNAATLNNFVANFAPAHRGKLTPWWNAAGLNEFGLRTELRLSSPVSTDCAAGATLRSPRGLYLIDLDPDQQFQSVLFGRTQFALAPVANSSVNFHCFNVIFFFWSNSFLNLVFVADCAIHQKYVLYAHNCIYIDVHYKPTHIHVLGACCGL